ncbi:uncharacterized protein PF3D7_1120000-like [Centruroides vittatus]|uniref:uncharacterized protein PF3D7_1120000-like n=1 Tax=Centruroides vittatus TaxID=120091 RepID=UPI00350FF2B3
MTTEHFQWKNVDFRLIDEIKSLLKEVQDKQRIHDFDSEMAVRAQRTAELYQLIDSMSKDESKFELLELKQKLRGKIEKMEYDIKNEVSEFLLEETEKLVKPKDQQTSNAKIVQPAKNDLKAIKTKQTSVLKTAKNQIHTYEEYGPSCSKKSTTPKKSNSPIKRNIINSINYPAKSYLLPINSCSCFQNAYFYPLAQPSRLRREYLPAKDIPLNSQKKNISIPKANIDKSTNTEHFQDKSKTPTKHKDEKFNLEMLSASKKSKHNNPSKNYIYGISDKENGNFFQEMPTNITNKTVKHKLLKK